MRSSGLKLFLLPLALIPMLLLGPALSHTANANEIATNYEDAPDPEYALPVVVVTADKRKTDAQKTPIAMEVITSQQIEDAGIETIEQVFERIPNLVTGQNSGGMTFMSYRGAPSSSGTETNPIVIYVDDVPIESFQLLDINLANIERIEILKGAQGVIYGKNAFAGIIRIVSKQPTNDLTGKTFAQLNNRAGYQVGGTVSGPIQQDRLFYSLSLSNDYDTGFLRAQPDTAREIQWGARAKGQLLFTPTEDSTFNFHFDYNKRDTDRPHYSVSPTASFSPVSLATQGDTTDTYNANFALKGSIDYEYLTFDSVSTYRALNVSTTMDHSQLPTGLADTAKKNDRFEFTQELRIKSNNAPSELQWLVGIYGSYTDWDMYKAVMTYTNPLLPPLYGPARIFSKEFAAFGKIEYPFAESWKLALGLRWFNIARDGKIDTTQGAFIDIHDSPSGTWSEFMPSATLSYQVDDNNMIYAGVSRSALPGGINYAKFTPSDSLKYDTQTAINFELGAKTEWIDNRLRVNPVLFYNIYYDLQELVYDNGRFIASNPAKRSTAYGAELDMAYLILPGLEANASLGYTIAKYDDYSSPLVGNADDNDMMMTPKFTASAGLQYRSENGFFVRSDFFYTSSFYWDAANTVERDPVPTVDARIGWESDVVDFYAYGRNIFGTRYLQYFTTAQNFAFAADTGTYGLELVVRF